MQDDTMMIVAEPVPTFVRRKGELTKIQKKLEKISEDMVDFMLAAIESDKTEMKLRLLYAEKLLGYHVEVSKLVNQDNLARMVAEIKTNGRPLGGSTAISTMNAPRVDFDNVISV